MRTTLEAESLGALHEDVATAITSLLRICRRDNAGAKKLGRIFQGYLERNWHTVNLPYRMTSEDASGANRINRSGATLWRLSRNSEPFTAPGASRIDLVLHDRDDKVIALVEVESDINDVRGKTRDGDKNYHVHSLARDAAGSYFKSYHSLERMAIACLTLAGRETSVSSIERICSDDATDHNPLAIPLFLVNTAGPQPELTKILQPRMKSLGVTLIHPFL